MLPPNMPPRRWKSRRHPILACKKGPLSGQNSTTPPNRHPRQPFVVLRGQKTRKRPVLAVVMGCLVQGWANPGLFDARCVRKHAHSPAISVVRRKAEPKLKPKEAARMTATGQEGNLSTPTAEYSSPWTWSPTAPGLQSANLLPHHPHDTRAEGVEQLAQFRIAGSACALKCSAAATESVGAIEE